MTEQRQPPRRDDGREPTPRTPGEMRRGAKPGSQRYRVVRPRDRLIRFLDARHWIATLAADRPHGFFGRLFAGVRRRLFGTPLPTAADTEERLGKLKALAIFASDALSSTAYATEEILLVLVLAGQQSLTMALPIAIAITVLLTMVVASYRQTVRAYPEGGGAYSVSRENLGDLWGLIAGASLMTDYVLTVAVSISAGVLAVISANQGLAQWRVEIAVVSIIAMTIINLRGVRESGSIFAIPTYVFVAIFAAMLVAGVWRILGPGLPTLAHSAPPRQPLQVLEPLGLFLVLRAFASGSTALTGVEAIANGVQAFKSPESKNAATTMALMGAILATFFVGATFLAVREGIVPVTDDSVISQIGRVAFGGTTPPYYLLQGATALILILAANTAFNGFPRLAAIMAQDGYMPRQFTFRGDRLAFSYGIIVLASIATVIVILFNADTHRLIPLYAVGVFIAFTLSQSGLFIHWRKTREPGWKRSSVINVIGAAMTGVVAVVVAGTKFKHGAWIVLILIPLFVALLHQIHAHYEGLRRRFAIPGDGPIEMPPRPDNLPSRPVLVPVRELNYVGLRAIEYARGISSNVTAIHIVRDEGVETEAFEAMWDRRVPDVPLVVIESPYRSFMGPLLAYVDTVARDAGEGTGVTIVIAEYQPDHWWQWFLHNRNGSYMERELGQRPDTTIVKATVYSSHLVDAAHS